MTALLIAHSRIMFSFYYLDILSFYDNVLEITDMKRF